MPIYVIGTAAERSWPLPQVLQEAAWIEPSRLDDAAPADARLIVDLTLDRQPTARHLARYAPLAGVTVLVSALRRTLSEMVQEAGVPPQCQLYGIAGNPWFLSRDSWEVSAWSGQAPGNLLEAMGKQVIAVPDRVGLVAPRVVCRIINEAYFLVGEGNADAQGVDLAMKLGVNYPLGPFDWADRIGLDTVAAILQALQKVRGADDYRLAPLLAERMQHASV